MYSFSVHKAIDISHSYPLRCQGPTVKSDSCSMSLAGCFYIVMARSYFPELLPIDIENPYLLSKCSLSISIS